MYELPIKISHQNSTKTTTRISIKKTDQTIWYSLFTSTIEVMIKKYNRDNNELETIEEIDEDKLCQVILTKRQVINYVSVAQTLFLHFLYLALLYSIYCRDVFVFQVFQCFFLKSHCYIFVVSLIVITLEV